MPLLREARASIRGNEDVESVPASFALGVHRNVPAEARLEGFRAGREEGLRVGHEEGRQTAERAVADSLDALAAAMADFQQRGAASRADIERLAVSLALELAEVLLGRQLEVIEPGSDVIARALGLRRGVEEIRVRMHPEDLAAVTASSHPDVSIVADATLSRGCAAAEIGEGLADLSISAAIERVRAVLT